MPHPRRVRRAVGEAATHGYQVEPLEGRVLISGSAPAITDLGTAPGDTYYSAAILAGIADADAGDTHSAVVHWGDGSSSPAEVQDLASRVAFSTHTYAVAGDYEIRLSVTDSTGLRAEQTVPVSVASPAAGPLPDPSPAPAGDSLSGGDPIAGGGDSLAGEEEPDVTPPTVTGVYVDGTA